MSLRDINKTKGVDNVEFLIEDVQLWDGKADNSQRRMSVEVRDGRIHWVGPASDWKGSRTSIRMVDGRARTLIPGLIDCHVHYSSPGGPEWIARFTDPLPEISMRAIELSESSLRSGVTTARDVGAPHEVAIRLSRLQKAGEIEAPRIHAAGTWIAHAGTYVPFAKLFRDPDELRTLIKGEMDAGADLIKVALAGWNEGMRPEGNTKDIPFDQELLRVAVEEAHNAGFKIACHANDAASCHIAAEAGVDSLEHGMFLEEGDLKAMAKNGTYLVPTMSVWDAMLYYAKAVDWPEARKKRAETLRDASRAAVSLASRSGVRIALGTDAGGGAARHGRIAREAELMVEAGLDPRDALTTATTSAAKLLGEKDRGTVEVGKVADMVLLDGDPSEDISSLNLVAAVFQSGRRVN